MTIFPRSSWTAGYLYESAVERGYPISSSPSLRLDSLPDFANHPVDVPDAAPCGNPQDVPTHPGDHPVADDILTAPLAPVINMMCAVDLDVQPQSFLE